MSKFIKMDKGLLNENDDLWIFQELVAHIEDLDYNLLNSPLNSEYISGIPHSAKTVYYLWHFYSNVGGMGIEDYLFNIPSSDTQLMKVLSALKEVKANDIANRLESGIIIALEDSNFLNEHLSESFQTLKLHDEYDNFKIIDENIFDLVNTQLPEICTNYIKSKQEELFI